MARGADAAVLGGGIIGSAIAHHLAAAGARVVLVDTAARPAPRSATLGSAGQVRMHHSDPDWARLAALAFPAFEHWADTLGGDPGFRRTGFAFLVDAEHAELAGHNTALLRGLGIEAALLTPEEFTERHPGLAVKDVAAVAYEPRSGYGDPRRVLAALTDGARRHGAVTLAAPSGGRLLRRGERITGVVAGEEHVHADAVVLAAGAWSGPLVAEAVPEERLPLRSKRVGLAVAEAADLPGGAGLPMVIDDINGVYFRPDGAGRVLFGVPLDGWDVPPEQAGAPPEAERVERARLLVDRRLPGLATAPAASGETGTAAGAAADGYTPDGRPLIGPAPGVGGLYLAAGFSGGGFKVAPAVGEAVAAELVTGADRPELRPFRPGRFAAGTPAAEPCPRYLSM